MVSFIIMRKLVILSIISCFILTAFSQKNNSIIKIASDVELIKLSDNAFIHVSYKNMEKWGRVGSNGLVFIEAKEAFLFDTPWNNDQTQVLVQWIKDSMDIDVVGFIPNHWHDDCMGGLEFIHKQNIESYANKKTIEMAQNEGLIVPKHAFTDSLELKLGDKLIKCYYLGAAHSTDNIVVYIPSESILFPACMVKSINSRNLGNTSDGDVKAYPETLKKVLKMFPSTKIVIPGHGQFGGIELIEHTLKLSQQ